MAEADIAEAGRAMDEARDVADEFARIFVAHTRLTGQQWWLGTSAYHPEQVWLEYLVDSQDRSLPIPNSRTGSTREAGDPAFAMTAGSLTSVLAGLADDPPLPELLLADARFLASAATGRDVRQALLYAAIAAEVAVKRTMREAASPEQTDLVQFALANPRDVSAAAASLFDKGLGAVAGRSLRLENSQLYKAFGKVFEHRNKLAHSGVAPSQPEVDADIAAAADALAWLATIPTP